MGIRAWVILEFDCLLCRIWLIDDDRCISINPIGSMHGTIVYLGRRSSYHPLTPCSCTYFTHAQTCDNVRVQSATQWTASVHTLHMPKPVITFVLRVLYAMDCFRTYFTHAQTCDNVRVQSATQ